jgi:hypothetical protein
MRRAPLPLRLLIAALVAIPAGLLGAGALAQSLDLEASSTEVTSYDAGDIQWRGSVSAGKPWRGALFRAVQLPAEGADFFTWDFPLRTAPNRPWRRWATDGTLAAILRVLADYRAAHPEAGRIGIADLSRPHGGNFGRPGQINRLLAQELVDRTVAAGAQYVFVGPRTGLTGPRKIVQRLVHHDDHMHVRFFSRGQRAD